MVKINDRFVALFWRHDQVRYIRDIINFIRRGYILISERLDHALYAMINADACITFVRGRDAKRMRIVFQYIFTYALY